MRLITYLRKLRKFINSYEPLVTVHISRSGLLNNLGAFSKYYPNMLLAPVLKSNAYGHGLVEVASILDDQQLPFMIVDSRFEAITLRKQGINTKLLVIGYTSAENIIRSSADIGYTITSLDQLKVLDKSLRKQTVFHLKIDTGMHRQGIDLKELNEALGIIQHNRLIRLEGVCSHFADADTERSPVTARQINEWNQVVSQCKERMPAVKYYHIAATAGTEQLGMIDSNVIRLGIGLYGVGSRTKVGPKLKPVLSVHTVVSSIRTIDSGETVGYNATFIAKRPMRIATIPVGYFEGRL